MAGGDYSLSRQYRTDPVMSDIDRGMTVIDSACILVEVMIDFYGEDLKTLPSGYKQGPIKQGCRKEQLIKTVVIH